MQNVKFKRENYQFHLNRCQLYPRQSSVNAVFNCDTTNCVELRSTEVSDHPEYGASVG